MAETHGFVKLPPDSTGKRIPHSVMLEAPFNSGVLPFVVGHVVTFNTSGIVGTVVEVVGNTNIGTVYVKVAQPVPASVLLSVGEDLYVGGQFYAKSASTGYPYYFQQSIIVGSNDPTNGMAIDEAGAVSVRFPEGAPQFDAAGKMQMSQQTTLAEYFTQYDLDPENVGVYTTGVASAAHIPASAGVLLSVGTSSGDQVVRASHRYHRYVAGNSQFTEMTVTCGDVGKSGCDRVWGYGDDEDGVFFKLQGTSFGILKRSSVSGSLVEDFVPQSSWNVDRLDGTMGVFNPSGVNLDWTRDNIYWVDFIWLGAGRVRYGVIVNGQRITVHEIQHANVLATPFMRTGSLPAYAAMTNTSNTASSSELRVWAATVKTEGASEPQVRQFCLPLPTLTVTGATAVPWVSFQSKQTFNGIDNRVGAYGTMGTVLAKGGDVLVQFVKNGTLTGATFALAPDPLSSILGDVDATAVSSGRMVCGRIVADGTTQIFDLDRIFNDRGEAMRRHFDITDGDTYTITVTKLSGTSVDVFATMGWREA